MANFSLIPAGTGNYTGMLTKSIVFSATLFLFLVATGMTIASIVVPNWIAYDTTTNKGKNLHYTYGLHQRCSNTNQPPGAPFHVASPLECSSYPRYSDCQGEDRYFCSMWRSVGFLMSFAVVIEGMTIAAFAILLGGGKQRRESGWGALAILTGLAAFVQAIGMALIVRFFIPDSASLTSCRHTFTRTTIDFSQAGTLIRVGRCVQHRGYLKWCVLPQSLWRHWSYPVKEVTNSFPIKRETVRAATGRYLAPQ